MTVRHIHKNAVEVEEYGFVFEFIFHGG
jgi:hypothetical protein